MFHIAQSGNSIAIHDESWWGWPQRGSHGVARRERRGDDPGKPCHRAENALNGSPCRPSLHYSRSVGRPGATVPGPSRTLGLRNGLLPPTESNTPSGSGELQRQSTALAEPTKRSRVATFCSRSANKVSALSGDSPISHPVVTYLLELEVKLKNALQA
jgi:hypothetical protein